VPLVRHTFQLVDPAVAESDAGSGDEILHRARNENLVRAGERSDTGAYVDGYATYIVSHDLHLACVKPGTDTQAEATDAVEDRVRTMDRPRRAIKGC